MAYWAANRVSPNLEGKWSILWLPAEPEPERAASRGCDQRCSRGLGTSCEAGPRRQWWHWRVRNGST